MSIASIRLINILSFEDLYINDLSDINCFIGKNNVGKSNVLKAIDFFYKSLKGEVAPPLPLNSNYSNHGSITIEYDTNRMESVVRSNKKKSPYQRHIYSSIYENELGNFSFIIKRANKGRYTLTLKIHRDNSINWSEKNVEVREIIHRIYPFFSIDTRRLDLYNWKYLWDIVSKLKFLNTKKLSKDKVIDFFDSNMSDKSNSYKEYVKVIEDVTKVLPYDYNDLVFNYIKVGLKGHKFNIDGNELDTQSDGSNSFRFIEVFLNLVISLTRREFITPTIFIDEPEIGLHPKKCEMLISNLNDVYRKFKKESDAREPGKYKTPYPTIIMTTHSPNILKSIIKLFPIKGEHKIFHFSIKRNSKIAEINSYFNDRRFNNIFSDNEARLFFSDFILFVEGDTELELFSNKELISAFPKLSQIDIHRTNLVMLKAISPSSSNVSIPYLVIYDADKILCFNKGDNSITFDRKNIDLDLIAKRKSLSLWFTKENEQYKKLRQITHIEGVRQRLSKDKTRFDSVDISALIQRINRITIQSERTYFAENTVEGVLINRQSMRLLRRWLATLYIESVTPGAKGDTNKAIEMAKAYFIQTKDYIRSFKRIFCWYQPTTPLTLSNDLFSKYIKSKYLRSVHKKIFRKEINKEDRVIIFRLAVKGKTDTLLRAGSAGYDDFISSNIRNSVETLKADVLLKLPVSFNKTGGWVSSFLSFSIEHIRAISKDENDFLVKFRFYFPELWGIIDEISTSID